MQGELFPAGARLTSWEYAWVHEGGHAEVGQHEEEDDGIVGRDDRGHVETEPRAPVGTVRSSDPSLVSLPPPPTVPRGSQHCIPHPNWSHFNSTACGTLGGHNRMCSRHPSGSKIPLWDPTAGWCWEQGKPGRWHGGHPGDLHRGDTKPAPAPVPPEPLVLLTSQRQLQQDPGTPEQHPAPPRDPWVHSEGITLLPPAPASRLGQRASPLQAPA